MTSRILIVDDEANIRRMLGALLKSEGFDVAEAPNGNAALLTLDEVRPDAILLDLMMPPGPDGIATLERIRERDHVTPVVMMSGKAQLTDAVRAIKHGAFQFLEKPLTPEAVLVTLRSALELTRTQAENRALKSQLARPRVELVGATPSMERVRAAIEQVAPTEARVIIYGESGTGKELVANAIHLARDRAGKPMVSVNCAAIPRDLVESEMFGHERGAFTGAVDRRMGRFELADGGTLFLDEIANIGLAQQARLLRVLQTGELERVGSSQTRRVSVRVIAATNATLKTEVATGRFREDLLFRLNTIELHLPALRDRVDDVFPLAQHFLAAHGQRYNRPMLGFSEEAVEAMRGYSWPGNVRELDHAVERSVLLAVGDRIEAWDLALRGAGSADEAAGPSDQSLDQLERDAIRQALARADGNVSAAAKSLGLSRSALYRRLQRYGLPAS